MPRSSRDSKTRYQIPTKLDLARNWQAYLTLGWRVNDENHPTYWLKEGAKPGVQSELDVVKIPAASMGTHTVVVAQSGAGKSYFVGRLIEEILLETKARCLILDSNSDFNRIHLVENKGLWTRPRYDMKTGLGKLPTESSRRDFLSAWSKSRVRFRVLTTRSWQSDPPYEQLQFWWPSLSTEFIGEELDQLERSQLYHCHSFVQRIADLVQIDTLMRKRKRRDLIDLSENLCNAILGQPQAHARDAIVQEFQDLIGYIDSRKRRTLSLESLPMMSDAFLLDNPFLARILVKRLIERAVAAARYFSMPIGEFYFAKARQFQTEGIIANVPSRLPIRRVEVVDLPSISCKNTRLLVANALLNDEFTRASIDREQALRSEKGERIPTFIVADEAHRFAATDPTDGAEESILKTLRTVAAEGRKYGLFLILVTQRPDKLDSFILSECENKALMRIDSMSVLGAIRNKMGLDNVSDNTIERCLRFRRGHVLLAGRWSRDPQIAYVAARRTKEGGCDLDPGFWAVRYWR
jgi:hypothetical protein